MERLNFDRLPLIEAIVKLAPSRLITLDLKRLSRITSAVSERFPEASLLDVPVPSVATGLSLQFGQVIGIRALDPSSGCVLVVQPNLVALAWQNPTLAAAPDLDYVRYEGLRERLDWAVEILGKVVGRELTFRALNMAYTDFIALDAGPAHSDLLRYFKPEVHVPMLATAAAFHELNVSWRHGGQDLRVHLRGLHGVEGSPSPFGVELTTVAGCFLDPARRWPEEPLDGIHARLQELFLEMITEEAMADWGYRRDDASAA